MAIELVALAVAITGAFAAGLWDLKTTEVPDEITTLMIVLGVFLWFLRLGSTGDVVPLFLSLTFGTAVLIFGWLLYRIGQWGGGDAKLFAAIYYLLPELSFGFDYIVNLLFVAIAYLVIYALALGVKHPEAFRMARQNLQRRVVKGSLITYTVALSVGAVVAPFYGYEIVPLIVYWLAGLGLMLFWAYAKAIEKGVFRRVIPVSQLKVGDVLASSSRWDGATAEEVARLKKTRKVVEIKDGVRFTIVFGLNLLVTLFLGNIVYWVLF